MHDPRALGRCACSCSVSRGSIDFVNYHFGELVDCALDALPVDA